MSTTSTLSEKIVLAIGTGKDPTELDNLETQSTVLGSLTATAAELNTNAGVTAGTVTASKTLVVDANKGIGGLRFTAANYLYKQGTPATCNATATITAADVLTGIITSTTAAAVAMTLPLATDFETALLALFPGLANDDALDFSVIVTGATNALTVTTNTGWTLVGDMTVANLAAGDQSSGTFRARRTAANTYSLYRL